MAKFTSAPATVPMPVEVLFEKFNDLTVMQEMLDKLPEEQRAKVGDVVFDKDSLSIKTPQVGEIKFVVKERVAYSKVVFGTASSPVPLTLTAHFAPTDDGCSTVSAEADVEIPAMLKPFVGPQMQKATDQFGQLISQIAKANS